MTMSTAPKLTHFAPTAADVWGPEANTGVRRRIAESGYTRVRYIVEHRQAVLRTRPASANAHGTILPLPDPQSVNSFDNAPQHIPVRTLRLSLCPACQTPGSSCWVCCGSSLVEAWIEILATQRHDVVVSGSGAARERHVDVGVPADFDRTEWPNQLVHQTWYRRVPNQLAANLRPTLDRDHDRVLWVQVQVFVG